MENVHLPSYPYGPYWVKDGKTAAQVIAMERKFLLPAIEPDLAAARVLHARGIPVFLTGDFNSPSFRDWTQATVGIRPYMRYPLRWPVSVAVEQAGFTDSFRAIYPNPVTTPGLTWPVHRTTEGRRELRPRAQGPHRLRLRRRGDHDRERDHRRAGSARHVGHRLAVAVRPPPGGLDVPGAGRDPADAGDGAEPAGAGRPAGAGVVPLERARRPGRSRSSTSAAATRRSSPAAT